VLWELDVAENIRVFAKCAGRRELEIRACASEVSLQGRLHTRASALSGGERRKLELLRALIAEPKILILDEPFAGVDPAAAAELGAILQARARAGMSIVLADHRVREALEICDEAMLLVDGRVELRTDRVTFREHPAVRARYLT
jgi:lipopolysaccharide export system ATP-binding protein